MVTMANLRKKKLIRRFVMLGISVLFLLAGVAFIIVFANLGPDPHPSKDKYYVDVPYGFWWMFFAVLFLLVSLGFLLVFLTTLRTGPRNVTINGHDVIYYRGLNRAVLYVDGEEKDRIGLSQTYRFYLETRLPSGETLHVYLDRSGHAKISSSKTKEVVEFK